MKHREDADFQILTPIQPVWYTMEFLAMVVGGNGVIIFVVFATNVRLVPTLICANLVWIFLTAQLNPYPMRMNQVLMAIHTFLLIPVITSFFASLDQSTEDHLLLF